MTRIHFFHGAADKFLAAVQWLALQNAQRSRTLVVLTEATALDRFDQLLWSRPPTRFLAHCRLGHPLQSQTPIILTPHLEATPDDLTVLNLDLEIPAGFERYQALVEIISADENDRQAGRNRFRYYRERGYQLDNTDISNGI